ncbi:hypothetical protein SVA_2948 [Sulfurifustis variabilis]|uniref:Uncharacterized protein n=1 Tax=Sulfurifustis variabilis TaxID=1675686 RepID=A0A1B4V7J0_9GAMM|nr:hypothetical protein [Sulfurifustis variabilis]BAU49496.1 hypothetical protein SVA_2948 [Sulfurifustis variabilis]
MTKIIEREAPAFEPQLSALEVVGRCGCGVCPIIFFQVHDAGDKEQEVAFYAGRDAGGGLSSGRGAFVRA